MPAKRHKELVVFDLDNTLTNSMKSWSSATLQTVNLLIEEFGLDEQKIIDDIRRAPSQYRFSDFGSLIEWLDRQQSLPRPTSPMDEYKKQITKDYLRQIWFQRENELTRFYGSTVQTLQDIKCGGTATALYTDAEASSLIRRLWVMARHARREGLLKDEHDLPAMFDHYYCQPSIECDREILKYVDTDFVVMMKKKMTLWQDKAYKPSAPHMQIILDDFATPAKKALMVGDTAKDGGCARPLGVDFAWCHFGADLDEQTVSTAQRIASPKFQYGMAAIRACFSESSNPTHTLVHNLAELHRFFAFKQGCSFRIPAYNAGSSLGNPHSGAGLSEQNPMAKRLQHDFHARRLMSPLGPATHIEPAGSDYLAIDPADKAGPRKPDQPRPV